MKARITREVDLKPIMVPNFIIDENGNGVPLHELEPGTLERLCAEFRTGVFAKANKQPPAEDMGKKP